MCAASSNSKDLKNIFKHGIKLKIAIGKDDLKPPPLLFMDSLRELEVTHSNEGHSGFQITLSRSRCASKRIDDYSLLESGLLEPFNRVIMTVVISGSKPMILMDGVITQQQLLLNEQSQESNIIVTGEDVSVMMDMEERTREFPERDEHERAKEIINDPTYLKYSLKAEIKKPDHIYEPDPNENTPVKSGRTDLNYLREMAKKFNYVFYIIPGQNSGENIAYWGPPWKKDPPDQLQKPLFVNMGPNTNVKSINFTYNALSLIKVTAKAEDNGNNKAISAEAFPLSQFVGRQRMSEQSLKHLLLIQQDLNVSKAKIMVKGMAAASADQALTAQGELDTISYGGILWPHRSVEIKGAGKSYGGEWHVKQVTHSLRSGGGYTQRFMLNKRIDNIQEG